MNKKVVVLGGGTGLSCLLKGLKEFQVDITAIVSVCDDGRSTGRLREEFNQVAVGDIRRVLVALAETEPLFEELLNYRFKTSSDLNGHTVGNLLLTAMTNITGNMNKGIKSLSKVLNLKGKVIPFSEDNSITLMGEMEDGTIVEGEHNITETHKKIKKVFYKQEPIVSKDAIKAIKEADLIILSMGSLYTSIACNLVSSSVKDAIDKSNGKLLYVCNMFTQPGETDDYTVSDHIKTLNRYLGKIKIESVIINDGKIPNDMLDKYIREEEKSPVIIDKNELNKMNVKVIKDDFVSFEKKLLRHNTIKLSLKIFEELIN